MKSVIDLNWLPKSKDGGNKRGHWGSHVTSVRNVQFEGYIEGLTVLGGSLAPAQHSFPEGDLVLTIDAWQAGRRVMDGDNLLSAMKPFVDGLEAAEVFTSDRQIKRWVVNLHRAPSEKHVRMRVTLEPLVEPLI